MSYMSLHRRKLKLWKEVLMINDDSTNSVNETVPTRDLRLAEAIDNAGANIEYMATLSDYDLSEKLDTIHIQMELAEQKRNTDALELLEVWRSQVIEARIYKAENNIPDAPSEIELTIADIETTVAKAEERAEILNENSPQKVRRPKIKEDNSDQISLF